VVDASLRRIYVIEVARTEDSTGQLRRVFVWKNTKYIQLIQQLRALFPDFRTEQLKFVIGICGTIDEHLCRRQLTTPLIRGSRQKVPDPSQSQHLPTFP
jgi:hypothetical protein